MSKMNKPCFLVNPHPNDEDNLLALQTFKPNDYRKTIQTEVTPKEYFPVAVIGTQGCGKSSLINVLRSVWYNASVCIKSAPIGVKELPGTVWFDGPYEFLDDKRKLVLEIWDSMGFSYAGGKLTDMEKKAKNMEIQKIARGEIKPGFVRYGNQAFNRIVPKNFNGVDAFIIVAGTPEEIPQAIEILAFLRLSMVTRSSLEQHPMLEGIQHFCIDSPGIDQPITNEVRGKAIKILMKLFLEMETRRDVAPANDLEYKIQTLKEQAELAHHKYSGQVGGFNNMLLIAVIILCLAVLFFK